ncbi:hypothetical protein ILYODFUR_024345 [Ilyodon furcidens]|uniref:Uncharacterized protein n=1 Tax=Ilyodon furcidens TaxID=33524 RepID=A0ABV0SZS4_9TELE
MVEPEVILQRSSDFTQNRKKKHFSSAGRTRTNWSNQLVRVSHLKPVPAQLHHELQLTATCVLSSLMLHLLQVRSLQFLHAPLCCSLFLRDVSVPSQLLSCGVSSGRVKLFMDLLLESCLLYISQQCVLVEETRGEHLLLSAGAQLHLDSLCRFYQRMT